MDNGKIKVVIAMSGGVDSAVSAALLKKAGFHVTGVFMKCWSAENSLSKMCTAEEDGYWARRAAAALNIPFYSVDLVKEYKDKIVDYFVSEYRAGRTPNPDVMCNNEIKFGVFYDRVMNDFRADYIATGHYARLQREARNSKYKILDFNERERGGRNEIVKLLRGVDKNKDQTYFLHRVPGEKLANVIFPIGEYKKEEVRELARKFNLPNAEKKDSQGLCFIGKVNISDFLKEYIPIKHGDIITTRGIKIGKHEGVQYYTVGQRKGIGVGGGVPYYVIKKEIKTNTLVVGTRYDKDLFENSLRLEDVVWINDSPDVPTQVQASIRYRQEPQKAVLKKGADGFVLNFEEPQRAVTSGQSATIYKGEEVLGGGIIV